jgi:protein-tyrosine phosphatase
MVDIHSHVLPGVDDGSKSLEQSVAMLEAASQSGTTDLVASPHASPDWHYDPETVDRLLTELRAANPTPIAIHRGCDFHLDFDLVQDALAHPAKYSINGGRYLLIELPDRIPLRTVPPILDSLMRKGLTPILTHPERYRVLRESISETADWRAAGCLVQITGQSLLGQFGSTARKLSEWLMERDLVDFIASDAHDTETRPPGLREVHGLVKERWGLARADRLLSLNPGAAVRSEPLPAKREEKKSGWRSLLGQR